MAHAYDNSFVEVTIPDIKCMRNRFNMNKYLAKRYSSKKTLGKRKHEITRNTRLSPPNLDESMTTLLHEEVYQLCLFFPITRFSIFS